MAESNALPRPTTWATAPNRRIVVGPDTLVYRDLGPENGVPLVLLTHLGATLDEWDPRFVDALARDRRIVALGQRVRLAVGPQRVRTELHRGRAVRADAGPCRAEPGLADHRADRPLQPARRREHLVRAAQRTHLPPGVRISGQSHPGVRQLTLRPGPSGVVRPSRLPIVVATGLRDNLAAVGNRRALRRG